MSPARDEFEALAESALPALNRAATLLCRSRSDVDDLVQETLLRAFKSFGSFRNEASFFTWAYRIMLRVAHDINRKKARSLSEGEEDLSSQALPPVEHAMVANERFRAVIDAVRALPVRQREMVTLYFLEDLAYAEIAAALDVSLGTVKATLFEAKKNLRSILEKNNINLETFHVLS